MVRRLEDSPELLDRLAHIKLIYTDLDGTLLGRGGTLLVDGKGNPCTDTANAIVALNKAKIPVVPVSGRSRLQLTEIVRLCGWSDFIAEAGAIRTYWNGTTREIVYDTPLWTASDLNLSPEHTPLDVIRQSGALEMLQREFPGQIEHHEPWHLNRETTDVLRGFVDAKKASILTAELSPAISFIDNGVIHPKETTLTPSDEPIRAYHLAPAGVSKLRAIEQDMAYRGLEREDVLMIGDGLSDIGTAPVVSLAVLVENALLSPGAEQLIDEAPNTAVIKGCSGTGWARLARLILAARTS